MKQENDMKKKRDERQDEQYSMREAYGMMDTFADEYGSKYQHIVKIAPKYRLPIRCPFLKEADHRAIKMAYEELRKELIIKMCDKVSLCYNLNGFIGRLKDRKRIFVDDFWNMPMFYQKDGKWHFGPQKTCRRFLKKDVFKGPNQLIKGQNPAVFKGNDQANYFDLGNPQVDILLNRSGVGNKFYDRNKFIEGVLAKKKGRKDVIDFLKKRLLPTCVFYSQIDSFFKGYGLDVNKRNYIIEQFKTNIELLGIQPIHYESESASGNEYFWYEDYAVFPNISIELLTADGPTPYHLPLWLFFDDEPQIRFLKFIEVPCKNNDKNNGKNNNFIRIETHGNYGFPKTVGNNDSLIWRYIFLKQSGLMRNAKFMADMDDFSLFKELYEQVRLKAKNSVSEFGITKDFFYPIFHVNEDKSFNVIGEESILSQASFIEEEMELIKKKEDIIKSRGQIPPDLEEIFFL